MPTNTAAGFVHAVVRASDVLVVRLLFFREKSCVDTRPFVIW